MKNLNTITDSQNDQLEKHTSRLQDVQKTINKHKDDINLIDIARFVVSEEGVKSYIVKRVLQLLNSKLSYYLKKMDSNCVCVFIGNSQRNLLETEFWWLVTLTVTRFLQDTKPDLLVMNLLNLDNPHYR